MPDLGYLDNNPSRPLKKGTTLHLPLWLAEMLAVATGGPDAESFVDVSMPPALSDEVAAALKADPRAVPLRDQSPHFYDLATRTLELLEEPGLAVVLKDTFVKRAGDVALHARKAGGSGTGARGGRDEGASNLGAGGAGEEFLRGLDEAERKLFRRAHDGTKAGKEWMENVKRH